MTNLTSTDTVENLKQQLLRVRGECLQAVRRDDFRAVARLTTEAARLNRAIHAEEEFADCAPEAQRLIESLAVNDGPSHFVFPESQLINDEPEVCQNAA